MEYKIEELVPIVAKLAEKYTAGENTSVTYERAEALMGAVLYCIHEAEQQESSSPASRERLSAQKMYEIGADCVKQKTRKALEVYNSLLSEFEAYGNQCLSDTFLKGLPEFFRWYEHKFCPQDTIITLDYPVLKDLSDDTGIDKIYEFLMCMQWEQTFFKGFPAGCVVRILERYSSEWKDLEENLCEIVYLHFAGHILAGKPLEEVNFEQSDYLRLEKILLESEREALYQQVQYASEFFVKKSCPDSRKQGELMQYLGTAADNALVRLKNAGANHVLAHFL